jgi:nitrous oxide reductase accessory protein NosL
MKLRYRSLVISFVLVALAIPSVTAAYAHVCTNPNKAVGAGSAGEATIDVITGEVDFSGVEINEHSGRPKGGFISFTAVADGEVIGTADVFAQTTLPESARNAGPGDDLCDGKGVDDAEACIAP